MVCPSNFSHVFVAFCMFWLYHAYFKPVSCDFLTHWRRDKTAAIYAENIIKYVFLNENIRTLIEIILKFVPKGPINVRRQVIIWTNDGIVYWHIYASQSSNWTMFFRFASLWQMYNCHNDKEVTLRTISYLIPNHSQWQITTDRVHNSGGELYHNAFYPFDWEMGCSGDTLDRYNAYWWSGPFHRQVISRLKTTRLGKHSHVSVLFGHLLILINFNPSMDK